jgi:oxepin-CoA hydrolase/3-oxo-5,6-dehydrosuberyl-CoA semialdehyde dehydrogenase
MQVLESFVSGAWHHGRGSQQELFNPSRDEAVARCSAEGLDLGAALTYARERGGRELRALSLAERGALLGAMARKIHEAREELIEIAMQNGGNTRGDAKFDIDGAAGTLAHYAELGAALGDGAVVGDGEPEQLGRSPRLAGRHVLVPRRGVALLVNAFNFPAWGFGEKAAAALLAGMPVLVKPATSTAWVAERLVRLVAAMLPAGALSLVCGSAHALPQLLDYGDVIAFTGSSQTAAKLRSVPRVMTSEVRLNVEADSLNAALLGPDVEAGSETYQLFLRDVVREMTQKAGQKCTAIRRIFVPEALLDQVEGDLAERLASVVVGDPFDDGVGMGPLASAEQLHDVRAGIAALANVADASNLGTNRQLPDKGYFVAPTLLRTRDPVASPVHELEVFGPVATLISMPGDAEAVASLVAKGRGGLVCSLYSDDRRWTAETAIALAPHHGRITIGSRKIAEQAPSPGTVLPQLIHGGPGRAGGGEELGGVRGLALYSQRVALQGERALLDALLGRK